MYMFPPLCPLPSSISGCCKGGGAKLAYFVQACLVQVAAVAYLFLIRFPDAKTTLLLCFEPGLGQMTLVLMALAG